MAERRHDVELPSHAGTVIVGAGIVGCAAAAFLAEGGATGLVVVDQGPLFRTGGSTSHAPGLVFQNNASRTVSQLAQWSVETYRSLSAEGEPCYVPVDSLEVATTPARWADLHRKHGYARSWGLDAALLSPHEAADALGVLDPGAVLGALRVAGDGVARAVTAAERLANRARARGAAFFGETRVTGFAIRDGRIRGVETDRGRIEAERVLLCGGIWGPLLGALAGVPIPLQPCAHPYVRTTAIPALAAASGVPRPIWRHQDAAMYLWQEGERYGIGSYRHDPRLVDPAAIRDDVPTPADLPFGEAKDLMDFARKEAARLVPALRGHGLTDRIYGLFSFTPDAQSLIGETAVRGLWLAEAVWVTHGPGAGRAVAELMLSGGCDLDLRDLDPNRFAPHATARSYVRSRSAQQYREIYDVIHPRQPIAAPRGLRRAPWYERQVSLGAEFAESNGWERVRWYGINAALPPPERGATRDAWGTRFWSPICGAEHLATRSGAGLFDLATFTRIEISGPGALAAMERLSCGVDRPVGHVAYALLLNERGGIESDVTATRLAPDRFLILAGSGSGPRDLARIVRHTRDLLEVAVRDVSSAWCGLGLWGPRAAAILTPLVEHPEDLAPERFPPYRARSLDVAGIPCLALTLSFVGEQGWELHAPAEYGGALWDALWAAGAGHGLVAAGGVAMDSLRLERGFRVLGTDLRSDETPFAAGLGFAVGKGRTGYVGEAALREPGARRPDRCLACLVLDDPNTVPVGNEPILDGGGEVVGFVTSANFGYTVGRSLALGYLPVALTEPGSRVAVEYFGRMVGATVAVEPVYGGG